MPSLAYIPYFFLSAATYSIPFSLARCLVSIPFSLAGCLSSIPFSLARCLSSIPFSLARCLSSIPFSLARCLFSIPFSLARCLSSIPFSLARCVSPSSSSSFSSSSSSSSSSSLVDWQNWFNAELSPKRCWRGAKFKEVGEKGDCICHHQNDCRIKMHSDESHFNVPFSVRYTITRWCPQTTTFQKRRAEAESSPGPSGYQSNA